MIPSKWQMPVILALIAFTIWLLSPILSPFVAALMLAWLAEPIRQPATAVGVAS